MIEIDNFDDDIARHWRNYIPYNNSKHELDGRECIIYAEKQECGA